MRLNRIVALVNIAICLHAVYVNLSKISAKDKYINLLIKMFYYYDKFVLKLKRPNCSTTSRSVQRSHS